MEYYISDTVDTPDFNLGENLVGSDLQGFILRYMENPTQDGKSIDNVCSFDNDMNVHYSSGVINKAFTQAVRFCQADGCASERDCVLLLGPLFMYANIHKLTALSGFLDSAAQTCSVVDEFYTTRSPETNCQPTQAKKFVQHGWLTAGVTVSDTCVATTTAGCVLPSTPTGIPGLGCFRRIGGVFQWVAGLVDSPFNHD